MTPRPEDVALVNRAADMLAMQPVQAGYGAAQRLDTSNQLRALASRLEGEGRDGERCPKCGSTWITRGWVCMACAHREHNIALGNSSSPAPASSPQPTTTTEEHEP